MNADYLQHIDRAARGLGWLALAAVVTSVKIERAPEADPWYKLPLFRHPFFWLALVCCFRDCWGMLK